MKIQADFRMASAQQQQNLDQWVASTLHVDPDNATYQYFRQNTPNAMQVASVFAPILRGVRAASYVGTITRLGVRIFTSESRNAGKAIGKEIGYVAKDGVSRPATKTLDTIHVTPQGVALPADPKYRIPSRYVENADRLGSYGDYVNGKFSEKLRIDPATAPGMKGPNYSHYHRDCKKTHYSPRPGLPDPGFSP